LNEANVKLKLLTDGVQGDRFFVRSDDGIGGQLTTETVMIVSRRAQYGIAVLSILLAVSSCKLNPATHENDSAELFAIDSEFTLCVEDSSWLSDGNIFDELKDDNIAGLVAFTDALVANGANCADPISPNGNGEDAQSSAAQGLNLASPQSVIVTLRNAPNRIQLLLQSPLGRRVSAMFQKTPESTAQIQRLKDASKAGGQVGRNIAGWRSFLNFNVKPAGTASAGENFVLVLPSKKSIDLRSYRYRRGNGSFSC
jgi:hypothetical protein